MSRLPGMVYSDGIRKYKSTQFRGYDHRIGAENGSLWDMTNLTGDYYPVLAPRLPRYHVRKLTKPNGMCCYDGVYWVDGTSFCTENEDGTAQVLGQVTDSRKQFACLGAYIIILPDKAIYDRLNDTFGYLEAEAEVTDAQIRTGTFAEEEAVGNTISSATVDFSEYFKAGDAVKIEGISDPAYEPNATMPIIREIGTNAVTGDSELRFLENTFFDDPEQQALTGESITISRPVPDMDFICENENRLWGCKGDHIYASKLGDPYNWNVFDGLASDSYQVDVGSAGDFTACASLLGYPVFFKEEHIYKVYGDRPSAYQVMGSASLGVERGSHGSPAIAGEVMFYLARTGIVAYSGGIPQSIAAAFGTERYRDAVGGSDGTKYYVSMQDTAGAWHLFVYNSATGLWHREDGRQIIGFGWDEELYMLDAAGDMWVMGNARAPKSRWTREDDESPLESVAEFGDFTEESSYRSGAEPNKKGTAKLQLRAELEAGASLAIDMKFDSVGQWEEVSVLQTTVKRSFYLPIIPRRSDHFRIRLRGQGQWRLFSLVREHYVGSELRSY